ncbi:MAG: hypothetical protein WCJ30_27450 [Deltaproteobacteria bacterium]
MLLLADEIGTLMHALEAVRIVLDTQSNESLPSESDDREASQACSAVVSLTVARLRALVVTAIGERDPRAMVEPWNSLPVEDVQADSGIVLPPWSPERQRKEHTRCLRRLDIDAEEAASENEDDGAEDDG